MIAAGSLDAFKIVMVAIAVCMIVWAIIMFKYGMLWIRATVSGAHVSLVSLVAMSLRGIRARTIVDARITAAQAGVDVRTDQLESHYLAQGNVPNVVRALVAASEAGVELSYDQACAIDLAGRDPLDSVRAALDADERAVDA